MALTKRQLAEQILRILHGGDVSDDVQIDERELYAAINQSLSRIIAEQLKADKSGNISISGDFITPVYDVPVKFDTKRNRWYSDIPVRYVQLSEDLGMYQVSPMQDEQNSFVRVQPSFLSLFRGMSVLNLAGNTGFYVEKDRIFYVNFNIKYKDMLVLLKVVAAAEAFGEDDEIPVPSEFEDRLRDMVVERYAMQRQVPVDKANDNNK